jgi:hypothetical protein
MSTSQLHVNYSAILCGALIHHLNATPVHELLPSPEIPRIEHTTTYLTSIIHTEAPNINRQEKRIHGRRIYIGKKSKIR